jgi:hypothetical protein
MSNTRILICISQYGRVYNGFKSTINCLVPPIPFCFTLPRYPKRRHLVPIYTQPSILRSIRSKIIVSLVVVWEETDLSTHIIPLPRLLAHGVTYFKLFSVLLQEMTIEADEDLLYSLIDFARFDTQQNQDDAKS